MVRRMARSQPVGSQLAIELALTAFAIVAGFVVIRALLAQCRNNGQSLGRPFYLRHYRPIRGHTEVGAGR